jgi:23S rRNA (uracil1939-C5)-methyltransferase
MRVVDLEIRDIAFGGKGVGRDQGKTVFVPLTVDGETVSAEIVREKKQFCEGEVVEIKTRSSHRVEPECPYFGRCGGCSYQHIDYEHQLAIKWRQVRDALQRIGKISGVPMRPIVPSPLPYAYRNRITVHVQDGVIGFFGRQSHRLIDIEHCPIAMDEVNQALAKLRAESPRAGHYRLRAHDGPRVFLQANDAVATALREAVARLVPDNQKLLIDAYCGAGFFSKRLVDKFERIIGIDWDHFAIDVAREGATEKETYLAGDIEKVEATVSAAYSGELPRPATTMIVDPPATGLSTAARRAIVDLEPATLIYISCNPATLARDLADLKERFIIESVTPFDMFPQTAEIEVAVHLQSSLLRKRAGDHSAA